MKSQHIYLVLSLFFTSLPVMAQLTTPSNFTPITVGREKPFRSYVGMGASTVFQSPLYSRFGWVNSQVEYSLTYNVLSGLDLGFGLRFGVFSPYGIGRDIPSSTGNQGGGSAGPILGADAMVRYLWTLSEPLYIGLQGQIGYGYTWLDPISADRDSSYHFTPIVLGFPLGMVFANIATVYLSPGVELGQTPGSNQINPGLWKNAVGLQMVLGAAFDLGQTKLVAQLKPRVANVVNMSSWGIDATVGLYWDL